MEAPAEKFSVCKTCGQVVLAAEAPAEINPIAALQEAKQIHEAIADSVDKPKAKRVKKS